MKPPQNPLPAATMEATAAAKRAVAARSGDQDNTFRDMLAAHGRGLKRGVPRILQINVGKICNLTCAHCHVNAGPKRKEIMSRGTVDKILAWLAENPVATVDMTGGAPEMIPDFRYLVDQVHALGRHIIDRSNLTILLEPGYEDLIPFFAERGVEVVASMPCYSPENVTQQRGDGVFEASIEALRRLNQAGYGRREDLPLHLVYNPNGAALPPDQAELEIDYKRELKARFDIDFHSLYTITNMPIARFASYLKHNGKLEDYMRLLVDSFNPESVEGLMCRDTLNIDWLGNIYDCDFNQQLDLKLSGGEGPMKLWDIDVETIRRIPIRTGSHCFGCTAGQGSSCGGALS